MFEKLKELSKNAYAPYSNFPVSSIVVMKDGSMFNGVNVEDASTRSGACAERVAIFSAIAAGYKKGDFKEIYVYVDSDSPSMPCFVCRQMLTELFDKDCQVICYDKNNNCISHTVSELCPYPFDSEDLK